MAAPEPPDRTASNKEDRLDSSRSEALSADFEDRPRHEIAADFGLTWNRTVQQLFRARRSLESALDARV